MIYRRGERPGEVSHPSWIIPTALIQPIQLTWGVCCIGEVEARFRTPDSSCVEYDVAVAVLVVCERMTDAVSVVLVDADEAFVRTALATLRTKGCDCLVAARPNDVSRELATGRYEVVVVNLDTTTNVSLVSGAHDHGIGVVVVTNRPCVEGAISAFRSGAVDYLPKPIQKADLIGAVDRAAEKSRALRAIRGAEQVVNVCSRLFRDLETLLTVPGALALPPAVRNALTERRDGSALDQLLVRCLGVHEMAALTRRERDVLLALAQGRRGRDLAKCLGISGNTCRTHVKAVLRKLGVRSQHELLNRLGGPDRHGA